MLDENDYVVRILCFILVDDVVVVVVVVVNHELGHARKISEGRSPMIGCNTVTRTDTNGRNLCAQTRTIVDAV